MRVITACDVIPGAGRQGLRLLARPAPVALGVPPRTARTRPALRARRHPEGADPQRVARRVSAHAAYSALGWHGAADGTPVRRPTPTWSRLAALGRPEDRPRTVRSTASP